MPNPATMGGTAQGTQGKGRGQAVAPIVPFIRASAEHVEPGGIDLSRQLTTTGPQDYGLSSIPAYGYARSMAVHVTGSGAAGTPTFHEDFPFSAYTGLQLTEPNGAVIDQFTNGYEMMIANKYGGYRYPEGADPRSSPLYTTDAAGNFSFFLRYPIEISSRDGLGSLPNQNAASEFKIRHQVATGAANGGVYGATAPTTQPTMRVVGHLEAWDQPESGAAGMTNQTMPPAMNTTQFWSSQVINVGAGFQTVRFSRVGNYLRNLIIICRRVSGTRAQGDTDFPDSPSLYLDTRPLATMSKSLWKQYMYERYGYGGRAPGGAAAPALDAAGGLDAGVFALDFTHDFAGFAGLETRDLWLPTMGSTRFELQGTFANACTLTVLTNDVAIAGNVFL